MLQFIICIAGALAIACTAGLIGIAGYTYQQRKQAKLLSDSLMQSLAKRA